MKGRRRTWEKPEPRIAAETEKKALMKSYYCPNKQDTTFSINIYHISLSIPAKVQYVKILAQNTTLNDTKNTMLKGNMDIYGSSFEVILFFWVFCLG